MQTKHYEYHLETPTEAPPAPGPGWWLWVWDAGTGWWYQPEGEMLKIGRSASAQVQLEHSSVSRRHALLQLTENGWRVYNDRALNGSKHNDEPLLDHADVAAGDKLEFGAAQVWIVKGE